ARLAGALVLGVGAFSRGLLLPFLICADDTPAAHAGLKPGDIITSVGSESVKTPKDLSRLVADLSTGAKKSLSVWREGKTIDLNVTVGTN
ncbi:PDZ domain-containing protein, partial [Rhizobium ruizarguesonis]